MISRHFIPAVLAWLIFSLGCSGGGDIATLPDGVSQRDSSGIETHMLWGMWQFTADPAAETLEFMPLRYADMHLNAIVFLEPPRLLI